MTMTKKANDQNILIQSKPFGEVAIERESIVKFPQGIFAFEELKDYVVLSTEADGKFFWLQSLQDKEIAFIIFPLNLLVKDYKPDIALTDLQELLQAKSLEDCLVWNIVTIPHNDPQAMTINQQGPIVINKQKNLGGQFISMNEKHLLRAPLLELIEKHGGS